MTFWPGTKTPISRGNAFDLTSNTGHSVMWTQARESYARAQGQRAAKLRAEELAEQTTAFTRYRLPGEVTLSKRARRELGLAPRGKKGKAVRRD